MHIRKLLIDSNTTTRKIQGELRRLEGRPFIGKPVNLVSHQLNVVILYFCGSCISINRTFLFIGTTCTGTDHSYMYPYIHIEFNGLYFLADCYYTLHFLLNP
jgi:hypothetical protein